MAAVLRVMLDYYQPRRIILAPWQHEILSRSQKLSHGSSPLFLLHYYFHIISTQTGQIRTHQGTFMIRPVEKFAEDKRSILHIIYRLESPSTGDYIDDILHNGQSSPGDSGRSSLQDSNAIGECLTNSYRW